MNVKSTLNRIQNGLKGQQLIAIEATFTRRKKLLLSAALYTSTLHHIFSLYFNLRQNPALIVCFKLLIYPKNVIRYLDFSGAVSLQAFTLDQKKLQD